MFGLLADPAANWHLNEQRTSQRDTDIVEIHGHDASAKSLPRQLHKHMFHVVIYGRTCTQRRRYVELCAYDYNVYGRRMLGHTDNQPIERPTGPTNTENQAIRIASRDVHNICATFTQDEAGGQIE